MTKELLAKDNRNSDFYTEYNTLFPAVGDECRMLIGCRRANYSASEIARAVEDCDAQLLNLNVTSLAAEEADLDIAFKTYVIQLVFLKPKVLYRSMYKNILNVCLINGILSGEKRFVAYHNTQ